MPVVRNPQFYFREGFCWNNVLTTYMKCKKKEKTVQSTESMSLFSCIDQVPEYYMISLMNSRVIAIYVDNFINSTSHCTTGDAKLIPVIIPNDEMLIKSQEIFNQAFAIKKSVAMGFATDKDIASKLLQVEDFNDSLFELIFQI